MVPDDGTVVKFDTLQGQPVWESSGFVSRDLLEYIGLICAQDLMMTDTGDGSWCQDPIEMLSVCLCSSCYWKKEILKKREIR